MFLNLTMVSTEFKISLNSDSIVMFYDQGPFTWTTVKLTNGENFDVRERAVWIRDQLAGGRSE